MISKHTIKVEVTLEVDISYSWNGGDPSVGEPKQGFPEEIEVDAIRGLKFQQRYINHGTGEPLKYFMDVPKGHERLYRAYFDDKVMEHIKDQLEDYANNNPPEPEIDYGG